MKRQMNGKTAGLDEIPYELYKNGEKVVMGGRESDKGVE